MKILSCAVCLILMLLGSSVGFASSEDKYQLILNSANTPDILPRNFRITKDPWSQESLTQPPSRLGLDTLNASGSGQFSENGLQALLKRISTPMPIIIVDLRQESHGFANGIAVSWYAPRDTANVGKTLPEIEEDESRRLKNLLNKEVTIDRIISKPQDVIGSTIPISIKVHEVCTEKVLTQTYKTGYFRIPVTDHLPPTQENVDRFLTFVRNLPPNTWLHFHCEAGDGRTTTFMAMYDIIHNAKKVPFEEIIQRQYLLGGINLLKMPETGSWKYPYAVERAKFLRAFYDKIQRT